MLETLLGRLCLDNVRSIKSTLHYEEEWGLKNAAHRPVDYFFECRFNLHVCI